MLIAPEQNGQATRAATPRSPAPQRPADGRHEPATAPEFREKLRELGGKAQDRPMLGHHKQRKSHEDGAAAEMAGPLLARENAAVREEPQSFEPCGGLAAPAGQGGAAIAEPELAAATSMDVATAEMAGKFAERLALSPIGAGDTHLLLDPGRYAVSNVTIAGRAEEGLAFSYEGGGSGERDGHPDEEALRLRLEARGLKVASIARRG